MVVQPNFHLPDHPFVQYIFHQFGYCSALEVCVKVLPGFKLNNILSLSTKPLKAIRVIRHNFTLDKFTLLLFFSFVGTKMSSDSIAPALERGTEAKKESGRATTCPGRNEKGGLGQEECRSIKMQYQGKYE